MKPKVGDYIKTIRNSAVGNNVIAKVRFINYEDRLGFGKFKNYYSCWREDNSWFELTDNDFKKGRAIVIKKQKEVIDKAIEKIKDYKIYCEKNKGFTEYTDIEIEAIEPVISKLEDILKEVSK